MVAKGSHATLGHYPKACAWCGQPVRISKDVALWFESHARDGFRPLSWHFTCRLHVLRQKPEKEASK